MNAAGRLAGFFAAHAVWSVSDGGPLIPLLGIEFDDGKRQSTRFADDSLAVGVALGQQWLSSNHFHGDRAVLIVDGFVTLAGGRTDALLLDVRDYVDPSRSFELVIPYRTRDAPAGFAVFRPKFNAFPGATSDADYDDTVAAFFAGVDEHSEGAKVWNAALDQSQ